MISDTMRFLAKPEQSGEDDKVIIALAALSALVLSVYLLRGSIPAMMPLSLRPFAKEEPDVDESRKRKRWTVWTTMLVITSLAGLVLAVVPVPLTPERWVGIVEIVPWLCAALITALDRPNKLPRFLLLQYLIILIGGLAVYSAQFLGPRGLVMDPFTLARLIVSCVAIVVMLAMPMRDPAWDVSDIGNPHIAPSNHVRSPEDNLTLFQFLTMRWVYPLAKLCAEREIFDEDVWQLPIEFQHARLYMAFREMKGKLVKRLIDANGLDEAIAVSLAIVDRVSEVTNIRLTSKLYSSLDIHRPNDAIFWALVMLCLDILRQAAKTTAAWYSRKGYERSRGETFIALFLKLLTRAVPGSDVTEKGPTENQIEEPVEGQSKWRRFLSKLRWRKKAKAAIAASQPASNAKIVNLVRGDTYEVSQRFWDFSKFVSQPVKVLFTVYYLIDIMGWPSSVGFLLMIVFLATNTLLVRQLIKLERQRTSLSDKRAQAVSHFVEASRPLKLNGWTSSWSVRIMKFRAMEMLKRLHISLVLATISTINVFGGVLYPLASICLYTVVLKKGLPNDVIWPALQLFSQLESSVRDAFNQAASYWKVVIPVERVHKYLDEPDRDEFSPDAGDIKDIELRKASFAWPSTEKDVLRNITLSFPSGLTVVRGKVGAGKSSLLLAAMNEMELHGGDLSRPDEPVGYAQQLPWLQSQTIRENIVFHQRFDAERYRQVLHACALVPDLAMFPDGDLTKLEEGGVGLSGGQKARVALARAVYSPCRILLLDDPLAALDHDTASVIVRRFLQGPLAEGRTIVVVTHRDDLVLRIADQVIDMDAGEAKILSSEDIHRELEHPYHQASVDVTAADDTAQGEDAEEVVSGKEAPEEASVKGGIKLSVYTKYMKAGGWHMWFLLAIFYGVSRYCDIARARLLEAWGNDTAETSGVMVFQSGYWGLPEPGQSPRPWLYVLAGLSAGQVITYGIAQLLLAKISIDAAQVLFKTAVDRISKATMRYHDVTPTGQLKNRLISDMGMVDGGILAPLEQFLYNFIALALSLIAIMSHQPMLLVILAFVAMLFVYFFRIYVPISRWLRRMEMRYLTPIIANIGVMQDGLVTIRAMRVEGHFQEKHFGATDDFQKHDHYYWSMSFWLDFRLSMSSALMRVLLILFMVWSGTAASAVGFVLTQTIIAMASVQQLCENFAQLQLDAVSLERVDMLNYIPEEPKGDEEPPEDWPKPSDDVSFDGMSFRYDDELPTVLDKVTFEIPGGSTCAVLGRTGSGKSTIANALLATQTPSTGTVKIGSMDISRVDRTALRNRVTFIQQDPTLFPGTLRDNIDPEGKFSDAECENAIHRVLGPEWTLDSQIDAAGKNLSQGQRQLVGIGRAVLRRSGLVILDEATASIDRGTAAMVQRILREELSNSTVITIAHRLEAVEDATWCLRLDHGRVVECGPTNNGNGSTEGPDNQ